MTDMICGYGDDRDEILVAYVYGDIELAQRAAFDAHLARCVHCRTELAELRGVRAKLEQWAPPEPLRALTDHPEPHAGSRVWGTLAEMPAWAQVAAALVFLCVGAGLANLNVRYDREGLTVRTGWMGSAVAQGVARGVPPGTAQNIAQGAAQNGAQGVAQNGAQGVAQNGAQGVAQDFSPAYTAAAWRADLAALERQLRREFRASGSPGVTLQPASAQTGSAAGNGSRDGEMLRRVRALVEESERKQQRELALRVGQVIRDVNAQREADLVKIDRSLGLIQNNTGVEAMKQRELLNYLVRVSQKQ